jgi:hypothetical protein
MANPLNNLFQTQNNSMTNPAIGNMVNMIGALNNPQKAIQQMVSQNPQMAQIIQMCNGKNPKDVFMAECQRRGVDPQQILSQLGVNKP